MKKLLLIGILIGLTCAQSDLLFSEYAEGSSWNKYFEIYNPNDNVVNLDNYQVWKISNGGDWAEGSENFIDLSGNLEPNSVYVICHEDIDSEIISECDFLSGYQTVNYNGDDALALVYNNELVDVIGNEGDDPGDGWNVAGIENGTKDHTLVRNPAVNLGNAGDWTASAGTSESDSEWIVYDQNEWDYIGFHLCSTCGSGGDDPLLFIQSPSDGDILNSQDYTISFSVYNFEIGIDGYVVYNLDGIENSINNTEPISVTGALEGDHDLSMELVDMDGNSLDPIVESNISFTVLLPQLTSIADIQNNYDFYEGQMVIVEGVVTIGDGLLVPGRTNFYLQDESGKGIEIYSIDETTPHYNRGDYIEVTGVIDRYNDDVQIIEPNISLLSSGNELPNPYEITGVEAIEMNGTWAIVNGELTDYWHYSSGSTEFTALTISTLNGAEIQSMFWNSAVPATELIQFEDMVGEELTISGVITFYNNEVQLTCGYLDDINTISLGCTDPEATNYNPNATIDDGNCEYDCVCTGEYDPVCGVDGNTYSNECEAECVNVAIDYEGECLEPNGGCTYEEAFNYDTTATFDDGSCLFNFGDMNGDDQINVVDILLIVQIILNGEDPATINQNNNLDLPSNIPSTAW